MDRGEEGKRDSLRKGVITTLSNPLITLRKGLTASQTDLMRATSAARNCHGSRKS